MAWGLVALLVCACGSGAARPPGEPPGEPGWPALQQEVPTWRLEVRPEDLRSLEAHLHVRGHEVPARFQAGTGTWAVRLSYRGRSTRSDPRIPKKSFQVRFAPEAPFEGRRRLELLASWADGGHLTEKLWYDLAAALGLRVPRARYVNLELNGRREGVYTELERVDDDFLRAHGFGAASALYRCGMHDCELRAGPPLPYQEPWEKKPGGAPPDAPLLSFLERLGHTPPHRFAAWAQAELALDDYLTWMALDAFIANDTQGDSRSYLVYEPGPGRWTYVPWDLNNARSLYARLGPGGERSPAQQVRADHPLYAFTAYDPRVYALADFRRGSGTHGVRPTWSTLTTRLVDEPALRARWLERLRALLATRLREEELGARAERMQALLAPHLARDPYVHPAFPPRSAAHLRRFVRERRAWLLAQLARPALPGDGPLVIDRVGRDAAGRAWVQLYNRGRTEVALEGLHLTADTRLPTQARLGALRLAPGALVTLREGDAAPGHRLPVALSAARPELALYAADGRTPLDLVWLAPLAPGEAYGRSPRGAETFGPQQGP